MRSKYLFAIALGILLVVALVKFSREDSGSGKQEFLTKSPSTSANDLVVQTTSRIASTGVTNSVGHDLSRRTNSVVERVIELTELGARNDAESFQRIVASLGDEDPEIREAALAATIQFGNRDAIPILQKLAARTDHPREKVEILEAAEYLALPSLSEVRAKRRTNLNTKAVSPSQN